MLTIYHNPRCSKSREGLSLLELQGNPFTAINYLNEPLSKEEITSIIAKLGIAPIELVRQRETIWIEQYKSSQLFDEDLIEVLVKHPSLIERPIVVNGDRAVIARPAERINQIL
jgi:arsenate reductase